jgi:hypothetical protein
MMTDILGRCSIHSNTESFFGGFRRVDVDSIVIVSEIIILPTFIVISRIILYCIILTKNIPKASCEKLQFSIYRPEFVGGNKYGNLRYEYRQGPSGRHFALKGEIVRITETSVIHLLEKHDIYLCSLKLSQR